MAGKRRFSQEIRFWQRFYARLFSVFLIKSRTKLHCMQKEENEINSAKLSELVVQGMMEKKGEDVIVLDLREVHKAVADFFVICSGNSDTHIDALSDSVEEEVKKNSSQNPWHREGREHREWILIDYVDVVAHIFNKDKRTFYGLEELWGDAKIRKLEVMN